MKYTIVAGLLAAVCHPALAQDPAETTAPQPANVEQAADDAGPTVFDGDWITLGLGGGIGPSYDGSDDYVLIPAPIIQGKYAGIGFSPRPAGIAFDLIDDSDNDVSFAFGPTARIRTDRANQIEDEVVEAAGELDTAVELGVSAGISYGKLLNPFDSLTLSTDIRWDVAGAHEGMVVEPGISYLTPLNRGTVAILSVGTEYVDDDYADYYYSVSPQQSLDSGLPLYQADGGFTSIGTNLLLGFDLDGNIQNGGFALTAIGGYSRQIGDAKDTPYTSLRGSADQFLGIVGIAYTF